MRALVWRCALDALQHLHARTAWLWAMLAWMWAHIAVAWDEWHMARLDHRAPDEWPKRIHRAARWRAIRDRPVRL